MTTIGGKSRKPDVPTQPQFVVQFADGVNEYARIGNDPKGHTIVAWVGDPNAATKFNSKYEAKSRTREMENIPGTRVFKMLEQRVSA